jgi:hypothetical protein
MKRWAIVPAVFLCGCYPLGVRPLTDDERGRVRMMSAAIEEHVRATDDPVHREVARAVDRAVQQDRVEVFKDTLGAPHGGHCDGLVVLGRVYLHASLLGETPPNGKLYSTLRLYHEGVHLTQSSCLLFFQPGRAEQEAAAATLRFFQERAGD